MLTQLNSINVCARGYLEMVKQEPQRWVVVNSEQKWDEVQAELKKVIVTGLSKS